MAEIAKNEKEAVMEAAEAKAKVTNDSRGKAKGTRVKVGKTRGAGSQVISYESFDESLPDTLPTTLEDFMSLVTTDEKAIVSYLIDGYNSQSYQIASDPIAEFVEPTWDIEVAKAFKLIIRQFCANTGVLIEDAVALIKPDFVRAQAAKE